MSNIILYINLLILLLYYVNSDDININSNSITPHWTLLNVTPKTFCIKYHNTIATRVHYEDAPCLLTHSPIEGNDTFETMQKKNFYYFNDWGCLFNADAPHHAVVKFNKMDYPKEEALADRQFLRGTTYWVNEHMAVGHAMYDLQLMQVLATTKIDRIVLQRAPCATHDLCLGIGTWEGWFRYHYAIMIEAFQPGIPIFVRWSFRVRNVTALYITLNETKEVSPNGIEHEPPYIILTGVKCVERVIMRQCHSCFLYSVNKTVAELNKKKAYELLPFNLLEAYNNGITNKGPLIVTLAYRGSYSRRSMLNVDLLINTLKKELLLPLFDFRIKNTANMSLTFMDQLEVVGGSHVVICEHGAFQSNLIYMNQGTLLLELRGNYSHGEFLNFERMAKMFGVFYDYVVTSQLEWHASTNFNITENEVSKVVDIVKIYEKERPYKLLI